MKKIYFIAVLVFLFSVPAQAATVSLVPDATSITVGDQLSVNIVGSDFTELSNGFINLGTDDNLQVMSVTIDPYWDFAPSTGSAVSPNEWFGIEFDALFNPPASGNFTIATVLFEALLPGQSTASILESSAFYSSAGIVLPDTIDSQVSISAVPLPPAAWLFLFGLGWIFRLSKSTNKKSM
ncbi:MAG: hypothetical protein MI756_00665 [Chromatiales bacterium]|nr:hypothetical protein [Chromatiales bacterium]